jgi:hypothetical protein
MRLRNKSSERRCLEIWAAANIAAIAVSAEKAEPFACGADGGVIRVRVPAPQPVIVLADGAGAKKRVSDSSWRPAKTERSLLAECLPLQADAALIRGG